MSEQLAPVRWKGKAVAVVGVVAALSFWRGHVTGVDDAMRLSPQSQLTRDVVQLIDTGDYVGSFRPTLGDEDSALVHALIDARDEALR